MTVYIGSTADASVQRHRNEVHVHNQLRDSDVGIVPLVGVYTTNSHPFGLIYKYMGHYDVRQYLKNEPNVDRVKLVPVPLHPVSLSVINPLTLVHNS